MKKISFFFIIPTLLLTTSSCTAMKTISLTHSQQERYISNDWVYISHQNDKNYSVTIDRPYSDSIVATLLYQPIKNKFKLTYSDATTHRTYNSSSFKLEEDYKKASILHFSFVVKEDNKKMAMIALDDTCFILPIPTKVTDQDHTKK